MELVIFVEGSLDSRFCGLCPLAGTGLPGLAADEPGIERSGQCYIGSALDEGTSVGKDGDGVRRAMEPEQHPVAADVPERRQAITERG